MFKKTFKHILMITKKKNASIGTALCCGVVFESDASSAAFLTELCGKVLQRRDQVLLQLNC